jgi:hypothetical protein
MGVLMSEGGIGIIIGAGPIIMPEQLISPSVMPS